MTRGQSREQVEVDIDMWVLGFLSMEVIWDGFRSSARKLSSICKETHLGETRDELRDQRLEWKQLAKCHHFAPKLKSPKPATVYSVAKLCISSLKPLQKPTTSPPNPCLIHPPWPPPKPITLFQTHWLLCQSWPFQYLPKSFQIYFKPKHSTLQHISQVSMQVWWV